MARDSGFLGKLEGAIRRCGMVEAGRPVLVAVSGGADSVALLAGMHALGYECVAAHCNFHLRGEESNRDMRSVQGLCSALGIDLYVKDFDVDKRRRLTGESVEMACRELRYAWFADLLDRLRAQAIAVAHHREDNAETFFLNLFRGSGLAGLAGMKPRNGYIIRPLLDFSRTEIEYFLAERGLGYVTDSTNAESVYARNRLRNVVIPEIERQFPSAVDGLLGSMSHLADNLDFYAWAVEQEREKYFADGRNLDLKGLIGNHQQRAKIVLFELVRGLGFNMSQCADMIGGAGKSGLAYSAGQYTFIMDHGDLRLESTAALIPDASETAVSLARDILSPAHVLISEHSVAEFKPERNPLVAYFDIDIMLGSPRFTLRHWQKGDRMAPYGMDGTKLISDLFAAAKYDARCKRDAWLLLRNDQIIWALGLRASSAFALRPESRRYLRLEYRPQQG